MGKQIRIGTRESLLAVWQATQVSELLANAGISSALVYIQSEGDKDLKTPLYEMGVQGIFTKSLDIALLENRIDLAVHSMKDVPAQPAEGIVQAAVLQRGPVHDLLVYKGIPPGDDPAGRPYKLATSSIRRKAQWLHKFPHHQIVPLRGNMNTRLQKLESEEWDGAIFAQAGLERIGLRPKKSTVLDWMLPAPAQGAILVACRQQDADSFAACQGFDHAPTALCTKIEREFLRALKGGCSAPISALAEIENEEIYFRGNIFSVDGKRKASVEKILPIEMAGNIGKEAAEELLMNGGLQIAESIRHEGK